MTAAGVERALRRRALARVLPGVFVDHTGVPTWTQRAWAAVLRYWPAALAGHSALRATVGPGWRHHSDDRPILVAVDATRTVRRVVGCRVDRMTSLLDHVLWNASPPRVRLEVAGVLVAAKTRGELARIGVLADLCQSRHTTAERLIDALDGRSRMADRAWLRAVLLDIREGTCSALEHGYLSLVERAHGLPRGIRQDGAVTAQGRVLRDVVYRQFGSYVELDGRLFHDTARQRDLDLERGLDAALDGLGGVRLGWGQVFERSCRTAARVGVLLQRGGWAGAPSPCAPDCRL